MAQPSFEPPAWADVIALVGNDPSIVDELIQSGATHDDVIDALVRLEESFCYDDVCWSGRSERSARVCELLAPSVHARRPNIERGRD